MEFKKIISKFSNNRSVILIPKEYSKDFKPGDLVLIKKIENG